MTNIQEQLSEKTSDRIDQYVVKSTDAYLAKKIKLWASILGVSSFVALLGGYIWILNQANNAMRNIPDRIISEIKQEMADKLKLEEAENKRMLLALNSTINRFDERAKIADKSLRSRLETTKSGIQELEKGLELVKQKETGKAMSFLESVKQNESLVGNLTTLLELKEELVELSAEVRTKRDKDRSLFGKYEKIDANKTILASSDGLVIAVISRKHEKSGGLASISGYAGDASLNEKTLRAAASLMPTGKGDHFKNINRSSFIMPVRKGEYYKVTLNGDLNDGIYDRPIWWLSIGHETK